MSFERPQSKNEVRANTVMQLIRASKCKSVPEAIRHVLRNEMITHEPDVKRIMSEVSSHLSSRHETSDSEDEIWDQIIEEKMTSGATEALMQRGDDPRD